MTIGASPSSGCWCYVVPTRATRGRDHTWGEGKRDRLFPETWVQTPDSRLQTPDRFSWAGLGSNSRFRSQVQKRDEVRPCSSIIDGPARPHSIRRGSFSLSRSLIVAPKDIGSIDRPRGQRRPTRVLAASSTASTAQVAGASPSCYLSLNGEGARPDSTIILGEGRRGGRRERESERGRIVNATRSRQRQKRRRSTNAKPAPWKLRNPSGIKPLPCWHLTLTAYEHSIRELHYAGRW